MRKLLLATTAIGLAAVPSMAFAQEGTAETEGVAVAEQCLESLRTFGVRLNEEGYWLTGFRAGVPGAYGVGAAPPAVAPGDPAVPLDPADPAVIDDPAAMAGDPAMTPWGNLHWTMAPGYQIRTLYSAAHIFARAGDQERCEAVLAGLETMYDGYAAQLQEAGVEPGQISEWRQDQIALAVPVADLDRPIAVDDVIGAEVRNGADEYLGSVEDAVIDRQSGGIAYVLVEYGGFLGIGSDATLVPWHSLMATPGLDTFVLNVDQATFENAPAIDTSALTGGADFSGAIAEVDAYWDERGNTAQ